LVGGVEHDKRPTAEAAGVPQREASGSGVRGERIPAAAVTATAVETPATPSASRERRRGSRSRADHVTTKSVASTSAWQATHSRASCSSPRASATSAPPPSATSRIPCERVITLVAGFLAPRPTQLWSASSGRTT
jgi:hypothetical protein